MTSSPAEADSKQLLTLPQLAAYLQISKQTLYGWRHRGEGPPAVKVGRYVRYRMKDVEEWLDRHGSPVA